MSVICVDIPNANLSARPGAQPPGTLPSPAEHSCQASPNNRAEPGVVWTNGRAVYMVSLPREPSNGNILLFDNGTGHQPPQSRAAEYRLDLGAKTATLVWQYNSDPHLFGPFMGFTQRLPSGNTLITYGALALIREVNLAGQVV